MPITQKEKKYLKNKHKGGKNNSKGAIYESYYATYQIVSFMNQYITQLSNVHLTTQLHDAFVDDLFIEEPNAHKTYHQLKDVKDLTWETSKLKYDFKRQTEISSERNEKFKLKLIYSNPNSSVSTVPSEISSYTTSEYFPSCSSINQLILSHPIFKEAIQQITVSQHAENDELFGIAAAILGAWNSVEQESVSLQQILNIVHSIGKGYVNIKTYPNVEISEKCKILLNQFGISFLEKGTTVYWSYHNMNGEVVWTSEIEQNLQKANPANIWDLMELLS